jgi:hypothetical protein
VSCHAHWKALTVNRCIGCGRLTKKGPNFRCSFIYCTSNADLVHQIVSCPRNDFQRVFDEVAEFLNPESVYARMFPVSQDETKRHT